MIAHEFWESNNPRLKGKCACGHAREEHPQPTVSNTRRRDVDFERRMTIEAARGAVDPSGMIALAESRAWDLSGEYVDDPMFVRTDVNDDEDACEEILDARNRIVWRVEREQGDPKNHNRYLALHYLILAYHLLMADD